VVVRSQGQWRLDSRSVSSARFDHLIGYLSIPPSKDSTGMRRPSQAASECHALRGATRRAPGSASAWFGERDRAFDWLDRAYAQHDSGLPYLKSDVLLRSLHGGPAVHHAPAENEAARRVSQALHCTTRGMRRDAILSRVLASKASSEH
jgi:hypothetical protein